MHYDRDADDYQPWELFLYSLNVENDPPEQPGMFHVWRTAQQEAERAAEFKRHFSDVRYFPTATSKLKFAKDTLSHLSKKEGALFETVLGKIEKLRNSFEKSAHEHDVDFIAMCNNLLLKFCPEHLAAYDDALASNMKIYDDIRHPETRRIAAERALCDKTLSAYYDTEPVMADWLDMLKDKTPGKIAENVATLVLRADDALKPSHMDRLEELAFENFWLDDKRSGRAYVANAMASCLPHDHARHDFWKQCYESFELEDLFRMSPRRREFYISDMENGDGDWHAQGLLFRRHMNNIETFGTLQKTVDLYEMKGAYRDYPDDVADALIRTYLLYGYRSYAECLTKMYHEKRENMNAEHRNGIDALYTLLYSDTLAALNKPHETDDSVKNEKTDPEPRHITRSRQKSIIAFIRKVYDLRTENMTPSQRVRHLLGIHELVQTNAAQGSHLERFAENHYTILHRLCAPALGKVDRRDTGFKPGDDYRYKFQYDVN